MAQHRDTGIKRVELGGGNWAEVRTTAKLRDQADVERIARDRGFESDYLDAMERLRVRIDKWSYGDEVTTEQVLDLTVADGNTLFAALSDEDPNASTPSSDGGEGGKAKSP